MLYRQTAVARVANVPCRMLCKGLCRVLRKLLWATVRWRQKSWLHKWERCDGKQTKPIDEGKVIHLFARDSAVKTNIEILEGTP